MEFTSINVFEVRVVRYNIMDIFHEGEVIFTLEERSIRNAGSDAFI